MSNEIKKPKFRVGKPKFQVGDEVEIISIEYFKDLEIGQKARIKKVICNSYFEFIYELEDINTSYYWVEDELKLVYQQNKDISEGILKYKINGDKTKVFLHNKNGDFVGESRRNSIDAKDDKIGVLIATSRALGFSKDTVDDIVNVIFKDNKDIDFKVGDRVIGVNNVIDGHILDIKGTIVGIDLKNIAINFDNNVYGHDFGGRFDTPYFKVKSGHGLWVNESNIKLLDEEENKVEIKKFKKDVLGTPIDTFNGTPNTGERVISFSPYGSYGEFGTVVKRDYKKECTLVRFDGRISDVYIETDYIVKVDDNLEPIVRQLLNKNDELQEQIDKLKGKFSRLLDVLLKLMDKGIIK